MKNTKYLVSLLCFSFCLGNVYVHAEGEDPTLGSYDWYVQTSENFCQKTNNSWKNAVSDKALVKMGTILYPSIEDPKADERYRNIVQSVKGDTTTLDEEIAAQSQNMPLAGELEKASRTYAERMDAIYDCAAYNTMLRSQRELIIKHLKDVPLTPNFKTELDRKNAALVSRIKERQCRDVSETSEGSDFSLKRLVIDQTTLEYCNYRHYLYYVDYNVKNRLGDLLKTLEEKKQKTNDKGQNGTISGNETSDKMAKTLSNIESRAESEITNAKESYALAFESYKEFERNYAGHILSLAIIAKLTEIRDHLDATANPMSQLINAGSYAQSTGK